MLLLILGIIIGVLIGIPLVLWFVSRAISWTVGRGLGW